MKTVLLVPDDAVQWSLFYPEVLNPLDLPLTTSDPVRRAEREREARARVREVPTDAEAQAALGEALYDAGLVDEADRAFDVALAQAPALPRGLAGKGWIALARDRLEEAEAWFVRVSPPTASSATGRSLVAYRLGRYDDAVAVLEALGPLLDESALALTQRAFLYLLVGQVTDARDLLDRALARDPGWAYARTLRAIIFLVLNRKEAAREESERAVRAAPRSPSALLAASFVAQAFFDLAAAERWVRAALEVDRRYVPALVQLGRLLFGSDRVREALEVLDAARAITPRDALVLALRGFLLLAQGRTTEAIGDFEEAGGRDPTKGDPHLGLGLAAFRQRRFADGLRELEAATLLEPRVSLFHSYLAKGLYQAGRRPEALIALADARLLDPRDPTPWLYRGIFLTDLNRPGEAVDSFAQAITLNGNRAVYRSRLLLDRDLATTAVDQTRAYRALAQDDIALSLAAQAVNDDPAQSGAHLLLGSLLLDRGFGLTTGAQTAGSEILQTRLLLPVNQNTFNTFNDYTTLLETPRLFNRLTLTRESFDTSDASFRPKGGTSKIAFLAAAEGFRTDGFRDVNDFDRSHLALGLVKVALGMRTSLTLSVSHLLDRFGDTSKDANPFVVNDPDRRSVIRDTRVDLGLHAQLGPGSHLLINAGAFRFSVTTKDPSFFLFPFPPFPFPFVASRFQVGDRFTTEQTFAEVQARFDLRRDAHHLVLWADYLNGIVREEFVRRIHGVITVGSVLVPGSLVRATLPFEARVPQRFVTLEAYDRWRVSPAWTLVGVLRFDHARDGVTGGLLQRDRLTTVRVSPQGGAIFHPTPADIFRFLAARKLQTHSFPVLEPTQVAGLFRQESVSSARVDQVEGQYERRLGTRAFVRATGFWRQVNVPTFESLAGGGVGHSFLRSWRWGGSVAVNWIPVRLVGLSADYLHVRRVNAETLGPIGDDDQVRARLAFVHPSGLFGRIIVTGVRQRLGAFRSPGAPERFAITDVVVGYEFPKKVGVVRVAMDNLFKQRFQLVSDALTLGGGQTVGGSGVIFREPDRRVSVTAEINF